jgi:hypothetical protein
MKSDQTHSEGEKHNAGEHPKLPAAVIRHRRDKRYKHTDQRASRQGKRKGRHIHPQATRKHRQKGIDHAMHGIENRAQKHKDEELKTQAHLSLIMESKRKDTMKISRQTKQGLSPCPNKNDICTNLIVHFFTIIIFLLPLT